MEFVIGIFVGGLLFWLFTNRQKSSGSFVIDLRDSTDDTFKLIIDENLNSIYSKKRIWLNVKKYNDNSLK